MPVDPLFQHINGGAEVVADGIEQIDPLLHKNEIEYDANSNVTAKIDANGFRTEYKHDALNRRYEIKDARGYITQIGFDANSNTTWVTDSEGNTTNFEFDERNLETKRTDPNGKDVTKDYNANWQLTSTTDRNGRRRDFAYDENGRVTSEEWYNSSGQLQDTLSYSYDPNSNLLTASNAEGTYTMTYDKVNRPKTSQDVWNKTLNFTHDGNGNRTQVSDSEGGVIDSTYDAANRLTRRDFDDGTSELRLDFTYTLDNRIDTETRYSDLAGMTKVASSDYDYDAAGRLTDLTHKDGSDVSFADYDFTYDPGSRLTSETLNGVTKTYDYDATNQLTDDDGNPYSYDGTGNRTNTGYTTGTGNRLTSDGTWDYHYDDEGNLTKKSKGTNDETWTYGYDNRNQMTWAEKRATDGGTLEMRADYSYDVFGNRIEKEVDKDGDSTIDLTERYAYDGWKPGSGFVGTENWDIWADLDDSSSLTTRYVRGNAIDQLFARIDSAGTVAHYFVDHLGSVRHMTDGVGLLQNEISYNGFGAITSESNPSFGDRYKYTGRECDAETNLQYNRARYYNPEVGRWTSEDPLRFGAGDSNLYRYGGNQSTTATDASGLVGGASGPTPPASSSGRALSQWFERLTPADQTRALNNTTTRSRLLTTVPGVRNGAFARWFNSLTLAEVDTVIANGLRSSILRRLRHPTGQHEWLMVSRVRILKQWGATAEMIWELRTATARMPNHAGSIGSRAHIELGRLIDTSPDFDTFRARLQGWANRNTAFIPGGARGLPEGLRLPHRVGGQGPAPRFGRTMRALRVLGWVGLTLTAVRVAEEGRALAFDAREIRLAREAAEWGLTPRAWIRIQNSPHFRSFAINRFIREVERAFANEDRDAIGRILDLQLSSRDWASIQSWSRTRLGGQARNAALQNQLSELVERGNTREATQRGQLQRVLRILQQARRETSPDAVVAAITVTGRRGADIINANPEFRDGLLRALVGAPLLLHEMSEFLGLPYRYITAAEADRLYNLYLDEYFRRARFRNPGRGRPALTRAEFFRMQENGNYLSEALARAGRVRVIPNPP